MSYFLWKYLYFMCRMVHSSKNPYTILAYHGLIRFLVEDTLQKRNQTWESFRRVSPSTRKTSKKRHNTLENTFENPKEEINS